MGRWRETLYVCPLGCWAMPAPPSMLRCSGAGTETGQTRPRDLPHVGGLETESLSISVCIFCAVGTLWASLERLAFLVT